MLRTTAADMRTPSIREAFDTLLHQPVIQRILRNFTIFKFSHDNPNFHFYELNFSLQCYQCRLAIRLWVVPNS